MGWETFRDEAMSLLRNHNNALELLHLLTEVWSQMERNRVGMALLHSEVLPTVLVVEGAAPSHSLRRKSGRCSMDGHLP